MPTAQFDYEGAHYQVYSLMLVYNSEKLLNNTNLICSTHRYNVIGHPDISNIDILFALFQHLL